MKARTDPSIRLKKVGVHDTIHGSRSPSPMPTDLAGLVEAYLTDSLAKGRARGTVAYRRVYLGQLLV